MSLASVIGLGYSGYAVLRGVPLLLVPSSAPEDEHLIKSEGAYHPDPAMNAGQLPAKQKRSLNLSLTTIVSPKTWMLLKPLTYGWRYEPQMDIEPAVEFIYVVGVGEGYHGYAHVDEVTLSADPEALMTMAISLTSWTWTELNSPAALSKLGTPALGSPGPLLDPGYKPLAGWNGRVLSQAIGLNAIVQRYSLRFANNWNYQALLEGYMAPPNPALITAGNLDVTLELSWMAERRNRPLNSGAFEISVGGDGAGNWLDTIYFDKMVREPRSFEGGGAPNQLITWSSSYFLQGAKPRSNL